MSFSERLVSLQGDRSARSFAQSLGISEGAYRALVRGGSPTLDTLLAIARGADVSVQWLATGEGDTRPGTAQTQPQGAPSSGDFCMIPRLDVRPSAGGGAVVLEEEPVGLLAFRAEWLRRRGINPGAARALTAKGDSMEPTIRDGDILLVDTSIDRIKDNGIYVFLFNGLVLVKRIHVRRDGSVRLISDNQALYEPDDVPAEETPSLAIAGRVMWFGRSI